ncbi:MAG TPA: methyltransferase domain-containing protein [Vicinamibacterales bacterium]|jgi:SAM-dependent methyltransferase
MATDAGAILKNLLGFYDFDGKTIVAAGAGGGQLAGYASRARRVVAVDPDALAIERLAEAAERLGIADRFEYVTGTFEACDVRGDVVLFEFCLHEMADPAVSLAHALSLAPDIVVVDHLAGSAWAYCGDEDEKAARSWRAVEAIGIADRAVFEAEQHFRDFEELNNRLLGQGAESLRRIQPFRGDTDIVIPMVYAIVRVRGEADGG